VTNAATVETEDALSDSETALLEQIEWMRLITDNVAANIVYFDTEQRILFINQGMEELYGLARKDVVGRYVSDIVEPANYKNIQRHIETALGGEEVSFEQERLGIDGQIRYFQTNYRPHFNSSGEVVGCFVMLADITDRVIAETELQQNIRAASLLQDIAAAVNDATSPKQAIQVCLDTVCEYTGWPIGHALMPAKGGEEIESTKLWHMDDPERFELFRCVTEVIGFKPGVGLPGFVLAYAAPHWIEDITTHRDYPRANLGDGNDVRSAFGFPVMVGDDVAAVLEFYTDEVVERDNRLLDITAQAGILIGRVIERGQTDEIREESEQRLAGIVDIASEAIISLGADGCVRMFNKGAEAVFGYTDEDMLGQPIDRLLPERYREGHSQHIATFVQAPEISRLMNGRGVFYGLRADGTEFPAEASISKLELPGETLLTVILRDITKRIQAEEAMKQAKEEAEHASRTKSEFLANMSHELRTPLNAIIGFSQLLNDEFTGSKENAEYSSYTSHINGAGQHLLALINDILDISKVEAGDTELQEESLDVADIVDACLTMTKQRAGNSQLSVSVDIDDQMPLLCGDKRRLKQVVLNLLTNAIKFTDPGGSITLKSWYNRDSGFVLQVIDTGIGMALEDIPKALARFQQVSGTLDRQHEGTGLGLPLSKALVELHGGTLDLQSQIGEGTTVTVRLPSERAVDEAIEARA
jgi:PAS domain S-box-containing protein